VPLPVKDMDPQQSCVTWVTNAIQRLQGHGWVRGFDLGPFKDFALSSADHWNGLPGSSKPGVIECDN